MEENESREALEALEQLERLKVSGPELCDEGLDAALDAMEEMRIHCPEAAFDELVRTLSALDDNEPGSVDKAAELAAEYDRCIGDLSTYQRAMVRVAASPAGPSGPCFETRRLAARAGFRSIARAVLRIRDKKKRDARIVKANALKLKSQDRDGRRRRASDAC
jgi:hypothetical protein